MASAGLPLDAWLLLLVAVGLGLGLEILHVRRQRMRGFRDDGSANREDSGA